MHTIILVLSVFIQLSFQASIQLHAAEPDLNCESCFFPVSRGNNLTISSGVVSLKLFCEKHCERERHELLHKYVVYIQSVQKNVHQGDNPKNGWF